MEAQLANVKALPQAQKTAAYASLIASALGSGTAEASVDQIVAAVVQESLLVARQVLSDLAGDIKNVKDRDVRKGIIERCLRELQPRVVSFEEAVSFSSKSSHLRHRALIAHWRTGFGSP
jgi:COP9 signalosome complex subunit 4